MTVSIPKVGRTGNPVPTREVFTLPDKLAIVGKICSKITDTTVVITQSVKLRLQKIELDNRFDFRVFLKFRD